MSNLLAVTSSINADNSVSNALISDFIKQWKEGNPDTAVSRRDVAHEAVPHLDGATVGAFYTPAEHHDDQAKQLLALSDTLVEELEAADVILIGAPMYNFSIPSGLLTGKKVYVFGARGGNYSEGSPMASMDFITPYLKTVLGFVGLTDVTFIDAEGVASGKEGIESAHQMIKSTFELAAA